MGISMEGGSSLESCTEGTAKLVHSTDFYKHDWYFSNSLYYVFFKKKGGE